jgi:predicted acylesterase/phospholipase RssA
MNVPLSSSNTDSNKRSLILAGGGMRVAYQAGVLLALEEAGLTFFHGDGSSGGIMNLAMLMSGLEPSEMCDRWRSLDVHQFASMTDVKEMIKGPLEMSVGDADGIRKHVFPHLGIDAEKIRSSNGMKGTFNVCNFANKTVEAIEEGQVTEDHLIAGISLPIFFPPVMIDNVPYLDAVWIKDANLSEAVRRGAEELWLVWCIGNTDIYHSGWFVQYVHMIEMSANGGLLQEFAFIEQVNQEIRDGKSPYGQTKPIQLHVIHPEFPLPLDPDYFLSRIDGPTLVAMGYSDACKYFASKSSSGIPLDSQSTKMTTPAAGLTFREKMSGRFSYGTTDPAIGAESGSPIAIHATIQINDIDRFVSDPDHTGRIVGFIESPEWGYVPCVNGIFNLFCPTDDPNLRDMVYEATFRVDGKDRFFAGKKIVGDQSVLGVWHETTTLYVTIHDGSDANAPCIGAGTLSLGLGDLISMMRTMHSTNAEHSLAVLAKFGKLFMGSLWETYFEHVPSS